MVSLVGFVLQFFVLLFGFVYYWWDVIVAALLVCGLVFLERFMRGSVFAELISGSSIPGFVWTSLLFQNSACM